MGVLEKMKKSIVFFDIDGTIWDYKQKIPDSTTEAVRMLREQGHYAFLCTGRTKATIRTRELLEIGWDGIVAGCGTYIEFQGEVLLNLHLSWESVKSLLPAMKAKGIGAFLEGDKKLYIDWDYYTGSDYAEGFQRELKEDCLAIEEADESSTINKISVEYLELPHEEVVSVFGEEYEVIIHDFKNPDGSPLNVAEILPKDFSKATGMKWVCDYLGIDRKDTYAFGDSANDIEMLKYAGFGVAMGNASEVTKQSADYVTTDMYEDGIWNGLKYAGLI